VAPKINIQDDSDHIRKLERVLRRISMPRGQVTLLKALYEVEGKFAPRKELVERIRWGDSKSLTGVLVAFSGRTNHTEGFEGEKPGYEAFIEVKEIDGEESFRLRPEARHAIERVENLEKHSISQWGTCWKV